MFLTYGDQLFTILPFLCPGLAHPQCAGMSSVWPMTWTRSPFFLSAVTPQYYIVLRESKMCSWEDRGRGKGASSLRGDANFLPSPAEEPAAPERTYVAGREVRAGSFGSEHLTPWQAPSPE